MLNEINETNIDNTLKIRNNSDLLYFLKNLSPEDINYNELFNSLIDNKNNTIYLLRLLDFYFEDERYNKYCDKLVNILGNSIKNYEHFVNFGKIIDENNYPNFAKEMFTQRIITEVKNNNNLASIITELNCINKGKIINLLIDKNYILPNLTSLLNLLKACDSNLRERITNYVFETNNFDINPIQDKENIKELISLIDNYNYVDLIVDRISKLNEQAATNLFHSAKESLNKYQRNTLADNIVAKTHNTTILTSCLGNEEETDKIIFHKIIRNNKIITNEQELLLLISYLKNNPNILTKNETTKLLSLFNFSDVNLSVLLDFKEKFPSNFSYGEQVLTKEYTEKGYIFKSTYSLEEIIEYSLDTNDMNFDNLVRYIASNKDNAKFIDEKYEVIIKLIGKLNEKERLLLADFISQNCTYETNFKLSVHLNSHDVENKILDLQEFTNKESNEKNLLMLYKYFDNINPHALDNLNDTDAILWCNTIINLLYKTILKYDKLFNEFEDFRLYLINIRDKRTHTYEFKSIDKIDYDKKQLGQEIISLAQIYVRQNALILDNEGNELPIDYKRIVFLNFLEYINKLYKLDMTINDELLLKTPYNPIEMNGNDLLNILIDIIPKFVDRKIPLQTDELTSYEIPIDDEERIFTDFMHTISRTTAVYYDWNINDIDGKRPSVLNNNLGSIKGINLTQKIKEREKEEKKKKSLIRKLIKK